MPAPTLQWAVLLARPMTLLAERQGIGTPERLLIPHETDPDGPLVPEPPEPTTAEKWAPRHVETSPDGFWMVTVEPS